MASAAFKADLVLHEGLILGHPGSDSVAIGAGRILAHGPFSDLKAHVGPRTYLIRLGGRMVAPGFIDSHLHFLEGAAAASGLSLVRCRSIVEVLAGLRVAAGRTPPGNWLRAFGCDEALLSEKRGPTREELDKAVPKNPLRLRHQTLHGSWLNSRAIALLGLERDGDPKLPGANLVRDGAGKLTGFVAGIEEWLSSHLPLVTKAEGEARARMFSRELAAAGVTAFTDATVRNGPEEDELFSKLVSSKAISQRVGVMIGARRLEAAERAGAVAGPSGVKIAGLKFMPGDSYGTTTMERRVRIGLSSGFDCAFHATEVEELEEALSAVELAIQQIGSASRRGECRIEHGGVITPEHIGRLTAVGAWVVTEPGFIYYRGRKYAEEPGLIPHLYRAASLKSAGVSIAAGTDAPVTPARPLAAVAAAVSRATVDGVVLAPQERLSIDDAFALFTRNGARLARLQAGVVEPDHLADLIVLPKDPMSLKPAELMNLAVDMTIVDGRVVYERGRPAIASSDSADLHSA
ncbi:MAG TPA: amidohydrolase family protein [Candidatus Binataceae bacterium]